MSEEEKTIWKKSLFSTEHNNESLHEGMKDGVDNLDIIQIQQKIKKINKRKKYNITPNDVEMFENIYETEPFEYLLHGNVVNTPEGMTSMSGDANNDEKCCDDDKSEVEGFDTDSMYEGGADLDTEYSELEGFIEGARGRKKGKKGKKGKGIKKVNVFKKISKILTAISLGLYKTIFFFPNKIDSMMTLMAYNFTYVFSNSGEQKSTEQELKHDSSIIKNIIYSVICFPICIFITYNWFFIFAYKKDNGTGKMERPARDANRLKINFDSFNKDIKPFITFWLDYCIFPLYVMDKLMLGDSGLPSVFSMFIKTFKFKIIVKFLLLILSFHFIFGLNLFGKLKSSLSGKMNPFSTFCLVLIIVCWFKKVFNFIIKLAWENKFIATLFCIAQIILYAGFSMMVALFSFQISSMVVLLYFWGHSLFGMSFYGEGSMGDKMNDIDDFVNEDLDMLKNKNKDCVKSTVLQKILYYFGKFLYDNFYYFAYFYLMSKNIFNSYSSLYSKQLKYVVGMLLIVQVILIALVMWSKTREKEPINKNANRFNAGNTAAEQSSPMVNPVVNPMADKPENITSASPSTNSIADSAMSFILSKMKEAQSTPGAPSFNIQELMNSAKEIPAKFSEISETFTNISNKIKIERGGDGKEIVKYGGKEGAEAITEMKADILAFKDKMFNPNSEINKLLSKMPGLSGDSSSPFEKLSKQIDEIINNPNIDISKVNTDVIVPAIKKMNELKTQMQGAIPDVMKKMQSGLPDMMKKMQGILPEGVMKNVLPGAMKKIQGILPEGAMENITPLLGNIQKPKETPSPE